MPHRTNRSAEDLIKEQLAELTADDERLSTGIFDKAVLEIRAFARILAADATAMETATSLDEWVSLFWTAVENQKKDFTNMFYYGCWGQLLQPDIPG